jgi:hypothetical protein
VTIRAAITPLALACTLLHAPGTAGAASVLRGERLSDERTVTRWAYPTATALVRRAPTRAAGAVTRLHLRTEDGFPEVYLLLSRRKDSRGRVWVQLRVPGRPNGRTGWVSRTALGEIHRTELAVRVNRRTLRVTVTQRGRRVFQAPIGVGAPGTPTPAGRFWVRERFRVRGAGLYGPRAIGTSAYAPGLTDWPGGGVVGFHGTNQPALVPGRPSHGCIRLRNRDVLGLYRLVGRGVPVRIV